MKKNAIKYSYRNPLHYQLIMTYIKKWKLNQIELPLSSIESLFSVEPSPTVELSPTVEPSLIVQPQHEFARKEFMQILYCLCKKARSNMNMPTYNRKNTPLKHNERMSYQTKDGHGHAILKSLATQYRSSSPCVYYDDLKYDKLIEIVGKEEVTKESNGNTFTMCNINAKWNANNINLTWSYWLYYTDKNGGEHTKAY
eukprot:374870_1